MFYNVLRTCWNKYVNELEEKLNERILPLVPVPSSNKDIDELANKIHSVITKGEQYRVQKYRGTCLVPLPVLTVLFQKWYRSTDTALLLKKCIRYFQLLIITYRLKIKLSLSLD